MGDLLLPPLPRLCEFPKSAFLLLLPRTSIGPQLHVFRLRFMRVCAFQGSVGTGVQVLSVSHKGIKLLKLVKSGSTASDYFRVLRPYR